MCPTDGVSLISLAVTVSPVGRSPNTKRPVTVMVVLSEVPM
ncbi:hypothetical protein ACVME8_004971 [Bradyrhizobium diazoefficiens]